MRQRFPSFRSVGRDADYTFSGTLQPREGSTIYRVKIVKNQAKSPRVYVVEPEIAPSAPHVYPNDRSLCLYHGSEYKWSDDYYIADDIVPWTAAWLYFYEIWAECGIWYGDEYPHERNVTKKYDDEG